MTKQPIPNPDRFDKHRFLESVAGIGYGEWHAAIDRECARAEAMIAGKGGPQARADGVVKYVAGLKRILNFFDTGYPLPDATPAERDYVRRIAERGVQDGKLKPETLQQLALEERLQGRLGGSL